MKGRTTAKQDAEVRTLEIASLLGQSFPLALVKTAAGSAEGISVLLEKDVFSNGDKPGEGRFVNAAEGERIAAAIPWSRRRTCFAALGEAAQKLRLPPQEIAGLFEAAQQFEVARRHWVKAAEKACASGAYSRAMECLDRALSIWPWNESPEERVRVLREMARCAANGGKTEQARRAWEELADYAGDAGNAALEVEAFRQLAGLPGDAARASEYLRKAAEVAERALNPSEAFRQVLIYVENLTWRGCIKRAIEVLERAVGIAEQTGEPVLLSEARGWQGLLAAMSGRHAQAKQWVEESLRLAVKNDLPEQAALAYRQRAHVQEYAGDYRAEKQTHAATLEFCRKSRTGDQVACLGCLSYACFRTGDWPEAIESARAVLRDAQEAPTLKAIASCVLGLIHAFRGERRPARQQLESAVGRFRVDGFVPMEFFGLWGLGYLHYLDGDLSLSVETFDQVRALWRESDDVHDIVPALLFAGGVYADAGHTERLADCLNILGQVLRRNPIGETRTALAVLQTEQARLDGRTADVCERLADAVHQYSVLGLPVERLWTECRAAMHRDQPATDPRLGEAVALARRLGTRPMLSVLQAGAKTSASNPDLTRRQEEVLRFLASGLTSKEIADRMGLSTRTVEMHVGRLLQRLNSRTRPEAIRSAIQRGWLPTQ